MPVAMALKIEALSRDLGSQLRLAELLGVSPAQVMQWLRGGEIDIVYATKVDELESVMSQVLRLYQPSTAAKWLVGSNPHLRFRRPIDFMRLGRFQRGARRAVPGARRLVRVIPFRAFPRDPQTPLSIVRLAPPWFARCPYVSGRPVGAVAEQPARVVRAW